MRTDLTGWNTGCWSFHDFMDRNALNGWTCVPTETQGVWRITYMDGDDNIHEHFAYQDEVETLSYPWVYPTEQTAKAALDHYVLCCL